MLFDKESGVGARGTVRVPARGMTDRSVRKKQQLPSLKRLSSMLRRWAGAVNGPSVGLQSQIAGIVSHQVVILSCTTCTLDAEEERGIYSIFFECLAWHSRARRAMKRFHVTLGVLDEEVPKASVMRERCSGSWHSPRWLNEDWLFRWRAHDQL